MSDPIKEELHSQELTYEGAVKKMLELGGMWLVREDEPGHKMLCHYNYVPHFPEGTEIVRLPSYDGQILSYSNYDEIRHMGVEELARFIARQRGWYCDFKDPTDEEYPKVLEWLKQEVTEHSTT